MRTHINRHVQSAFAVKHACAAVDSDANCFPSHEGTTAATAPPIDMLAPTERYDRVSGGCLTAILEHEKYNLGEGFAFLKLSMSLIERGAAFCTDPNRTAVFAEMNSTLEQGMAYHRSNRALHCPSSTTQTLSSASPGLPYLPRACPTVPCPSVRSRVS